MLFAPFRGSLFDPAIVTDLPAATSPPYDVISAADARRYRAASNYNMVRLLLSGPQDPTYEESARLLSRWREDGSLRTDAEPRFYAYQMRYQDPAGEPRLAGGIIGALALLPLGERVLPHEETMPRTKADRLALLTATQANLDLIIALTPAPEFRHLAQPAGPPRLDLVVEGVQHSLYEIADPQTIAALSAAVEAHPVAIADGHHRYTTGLHYQETRNQPGPWDRVMVWLVPTGGSGLTIGATHRVFPHVEFDPADLGERFIVQSSDPVPPEDPGSVVLVPGENHQSGPLKLTGRDDFLARLPDPWRDAGPAVARALLYDLLGVDESEADYHSDGADALAASTRAPDGAVALMAPLPEAAVSLATETGVRFPQKSTFYRPKPRSGLVIRCFDDD